MTNSAKNNPKPKFRLTFKLSEEVKPREDGIEGVLLVPHIEIGNEDYNFATVDTLMVVESAFKAGEYNIYNCSCGEPSCSGYDDGIIVLHHKQFVEWKIPVPLAIPLNEIRTDCRLYRSVNVGTLPEYRKSIFAGIQQAAILVSKCKLPVFLLPMWTNIPHLIKRANNLKRLTHLTNNPIGAHHEHSPSPESRNITHI